MMSRSLFRVVWKGRSRVPCLRRSRAVLNRPALLFAWGDEFDGRDSKDVAGYDALTPDGISAAYPGLRSIPITFGWS